MTHAVVNKSDDVRVMKLTEDFSLLLEGLLFDFGVGDYLYSEKGLVDNISGLEWDNFHYRYLLFYFISFN